MPKNTTYSFPPDSLLSEVSEDTRKAWALLSRPPGQRIFTNLEDAETYSKAHPGMQVQVKLTAPVTFESFDTPEEQV